MILSFHPCYVADVNRLCAGRAPDADDRAAIRRATGVILPQGCQPALYRMARENCPHVFPNYDVRFQYPGKTGQARLFKKMGQACPCTWIFEDSDQFHQRWADVRDAGFPLVLKLDWGGEGDTVFMMQSPADLEQAMAAAVEYERTGQRGFVLQTFVPHGNRSLRVAVIGKTMMAYWRVQDEATVFGTSLAKGARVDHQSDPHLRRLALDVVTDFCLHTGVNLAGIDVIFDEADRSGDNPQPLLLEINYFFGRTGLGGSERFYTLFQDAVDRWLADLELAVNRPLAKAFSEGDR